MRFRQIALLFLLSFRSANSALAQSPNGTISGLVLDSSRAVIVGAEITIVNDATHAQFSAKTNGDGICRSSRVRISDLFHVLKGESKATEANGAGASNPDEDGGSVWRATARDLGKTPTEVTEIVAHVFGGLGSNHTSAAEDPRRVQSLQERSPIFLA